MGVCARGLTVRVTQNMKYMGTICGITSFIWVWARRQLSVSTGSVLRSMSVTSSNSAASVCTCAPHTESARCLTGYECGLPRGPGFSYGSHSERGRGFGSGAWSVVKTRSSLKQQTCYNVVRQTPRSQHGSSGSCRRVKP